MTKDERELLLTIATAVTGMLEGMADMASPVIKRQTYDVAVRLTNLIAKVEHETEEFE